MGRRRGVGGGLGGKRGLAVGGGGRGHSAPCLPLGASVLMCCLSSLAGIGKNVICDRAATPLDAFRMMSAAHYYPKLMSVMGNVLRFLPAFVRMKQLIEEGYVGELLVCEVQVHSGSLLGKKYNWSCDDLMGGGGLHSVGTYIIDLLTFLTGQKAVKVHGLLKTFVKQTDHIKGIRQITSDEELTA